MKQVKGRDGKQRPPEISVQVGEREGWLKSPGRNPKSLSRGVPSHEENNLASQRGEMKARGPGSLVESWGREAQAPN